MREIKFRAKVKGDAGIWGVQAIDWPNQRVFLDGARANWHPMDKIKAFMQFTGLKDKNGKEVWEGDLLKHDLWGTSEIIWDKECANFRGKNEEHDITLADHQLQRSRVIGNIYQNPELLKAD